MESSARIVEALGELEAPRAFLAQLFEHAPVAFQIYALDGHCVLVNRAFRDLFQSVPPPEYNVLQDDVLERQGLLQLIHRAFAGETVLIPATWYDPRELRQVQVSDGRRVGIEVSLFPIRDGAGAIAYIALAVKDVTAELALRETTAALERSEQRFRATFEQAAVGIAHVATDGRWLAVNQRFCDIVGYSREELLSQRFQEITHPEDVDADLGFVRQLLEGRITAYTMEKRYVCKDGRHIWIDLTVAMVRDESAAPDYFISVIQDISQRKGAQAELAQTASDLAIEVDERARAERALRASEENLATTLDSIGDAVIATDERGRITRMNPVAEQLTGWQRADAQGRQLEEVFAISSETTREPLLSPFERVLRNESPAKLGNRTLLRARDGTERPISDSCAAIRDTLGVFLGVVLVFRDQTEERLAQRALRHSEARQRAILEAALDCIVTADQDGTITEFNPAAESTFGYSRAEAVGRPIADMLVPPALRQRHQQGLRRYLETGVGPVLGKRIEIQGMRADGSEFPVELAVVPTESEGTQFFTAYIRDITERHRAAHALQESEARFRHLAESGIIGIIVADTLGGIHEANDTFLRIVGRARAELEAGKLRWTDLTPPEWRSLDDVAAVQLEETGAAKPWEKEYYRKDGSRAPVLVGVVMLEPPRCIAFVLDLSERKHAEEGRVRALEVAVRASEERERAERAIRELEEQLRQSQKMEAVGTLAGSIAHDFNNLLSVILGYADIMQQELQPADPLTAEVDQIHRAAKRASDLTRQLLAFSRQQVLEPRVINLNMAIAGMTRMMQRLIGEHIELVLSTSPDLGNVYVDPGQIELALLNLLVNARDAMPTGGKLTVETANAELDAGYAAAHLDVAPGSYVLLRVSDTGSGMDRATSNRIFEPFFTTKEKGKGTGLGLSTVFGIVKQSGGHIWVESAVGKGSSFEVYLPRTHASASPSDHLTLPPLNLRGSETILLVEDDEQVRTLAVSILRKNGYRVMDAATGGDALLICEQFSGFIHLLITDVVMPRMSGRQLWERLTPLRRQLKVLFMSGYTDDAIVHHGVSSSEFAFIQKPIQPNNLLAKVRRVLDDGKG